MSGSIVSKELLAQNAAAYLRKLCREIDNRRVGSAGNRQATDFFTQIVTQFGFETSCPEFTCMDWRGSMAQLAVGEQVFEAFPSPYSQGCRVEGQLMSAATVAELECIEAKNQVLLLRGELTQEQLMPKNFTFYNPEHHQQIICLLESKQPAAIVAATGRNPELAGGLYPFPLIEDGDFEIPSVYLKDVVGEELATYHGQKVKLLSEAERIPATGCNVIARRGNMENRLVVSAHIDAKVGSPGAIDNAGGVVVLLVLAQLLADYQGQLGVELLAFNGEDYYSAPGQVQYLQQNRDTIPQILLAANLDGVGYIEGQTAYSTYECTPMLERAAKQAFAPYSDIVPGEQWYQSDHMVFVQNGRPAVAITSEAFGMLSATITHTEADRPEIVAVEKLVNTALALCDLLGKLNQIID
jgi:aminopeptidase YwaD